MALLLQLLLLLLLRPGLVLQQRRRDHLVRLSRRPHPAQQGVGAAAVAAGKGIRAEEAHHFLSQ